MRHLLELLQVVNHQAAEEGGAVFQRRLENNNLGALGFDALHNTLDGALAEVVGVRFHRQAVDTDGGSGEWRVENSLFSVYE